MAYGAMANEQLEAQEVFRELVNLPPERLRWLCSYLRTWELGFEGWRPPITTPDSEVAVDCARIMRAVFPVKPNE